VFMTAVVPMTAVAVFMTAVVPMTAVPMTVSGERWHWKQHGSRDCADESDFAKES